jgi:leucyl aminopeptidase
VPPMATHPKISFAKYSPLTAGTVVVLAHDDLTFSADAQGAVAHIGDVARTASVAKFKAASGKVLEVLTPGNGPLDRVIVLGLGKTDGTAKINWLNLGGQAAAALASLDTATIMLSSPHVELGADDVAQFALGLRLRSYRFDTYKTKQKDEEKERLEKVTLLVADDVAAKKAWKAIESIAEGVEIARTLVNEPPNVVNPEAFVECASALKEHGVEIDVLDEKKLAKLGLNALLAVGRGSHRESHVVVMRWNGAKNDSAPLVVVGKGVTFDSGGISIKPSASMEDMKGDMAGAACVVGLMHALAGRKAKANVIGLIGVVENMPDANAYRPGDILTSLSGQTIEIVNTDAEGRLVLADVLWYAQDKFKPAAMINLATLTGAVLVALGQEHAGLFSNNDELADRLYNAGKDTDEKVWRLPMGKEFDKLIDSKFADMKNSGGRYAGSITAAQFLQRFVNDVPWAHLDIAGTGMAAVKSDINTSWGSGWGVRLLDRLVSDHYEKGD